LFRLEPGDPGALVYDLRGHRYVNLTNRCSADCAFCPRRRDRRLHGLDLTLRREPTVAEVMAAIGDPKAHAEIVFCGFGEPVLRLPALLEIGRQVRARGGRVRVNTNGQADLIFGRDILPSCRDAVDEWSVSLNTMDTAQYQRLVRPAAGPDVLTAVQAFAARAAQSGFRVTATAVEMSDVDGTALQAWCRSTGVRYRGRALARLDEPED
jgi:TatD DNase family protein